MKKVKELNLSKKIAGKRWSPTSKDKREFVICEEHNKEINKIEKDIREFIKRLRKLDRWVSDKMWKKEIDKLARDDLVK